MSSHTSYFTRSTLIVMRSTATTLTALPALIGSPATASQYSLWTYTFPPGERSVAAVPTSPIEPDGARSDAPPLGQEAHRDGDEEEDDEERDRRHERVLFDAEKSHERPQKVQDAL